MGWATGQNAKGREVGYGVSATCDEPGCETKIDRGLDYACGGMHEGVGVGREPGCGKYFCGPHRPRMVKAADGRFVDVCAACATAIPADEDEED